MLKLMKLINKRRKRATAWQQGSKYKSVLPRHSGPAQEIHLHAVVKFLAAGVYRLGILSQLQARFFPIYFFNFILGYIFGFFSLEVFHLKENVFHHYAALLTHGSSLLTWHANLKVKTELSTTLSSVSGILKLVLTKKGFLCHRPCLWK